MKFILAITLSVLPSLSQAESEKTTDKVTVFKIKGSSNYAAEKWVDHALGIVCYHAGNSVMEGGKAISCIKFR